MDQLVGSRPLGHLGHTKVHDGNSAHANISNIDGREIRYPEYEVNGHISEHHIQRNADSGTQG